MLERDSDQIHRTICKYPLGIMTLFANMTTHDDNASLLFPIELKRTMYGLAEGIISFRDPVGQNLSNFNEYTSHLGCLLNYRF